MNKEKELFFLLKDNQFINSYLKVEYTKYMEFIDIYDIYLDNDHIFSIVKIISSRGIYYSYYSNILKTDFSDINRGIRLIKSVILKEKRKERIKDLDI